MVWATGGVEASCRNPKTKRPHAPTGGFGRFFVLPALEMEIENNLEMTLSKAKNSIFGNVEPCKLLEPGSSSHDARGSKLDLVLIKKLFWSPKASDIRAVHQTCVLHVGVSLKLFPTVLE